jgi:hypothetical protein
MDNKFWLVNFRARPVLSTDIYNARGQNHMTPEATCSLNFTDTAVTFTGCFQVLNIQDDKKVSTHLMITKQKVTNNVQCVPRQSPHIY